MKSRERLGSRLGFIMLSAGCAIGCGNVWKFPWMCGQYGGGSFMVLYVLFLALLGLPVLIMEFSVGRAAQTSPVKMYGKLEKKGSRWHIWGYISLFGNVALMAFYTVVAGWMLYYFYRFASGKTQSLGFLEMTRNAGVNVTVLTVTVAAAFLILSFDLQSGLERVTKVMMISLLGLLLVLAVHSLMLPSAKEGLSFYLIPDISKINGKVAVGAMNQAFFTLSVGIGGMAIFGSYIDKDRSLAGEAVHVIVLDTLVAVIAGLIIFPACFAYKLEVTSGPSLLFDTMANVFTHMPGGRWWGTAFFLFMVFAAMSTVLGVCENILAMVRELTGWSRPAGSIVCGIVIWVLSLTTALGFNVWHFHPFSTESTWMDLWDFIVSTNLLPLGSMILALFCTGRSGWGWERFLEEANEGRGLKIGKWLRPLFQFIVPAGILIVYVYGLATFKWH